MNRKVLLVIALCAMVAVVAAPATFGQAGGSMSTAFAVQNLDVGSADVFVSFYNTSGTATNTLNRSIAEGGNYNFDQRYDSGNPGSEPFQGSAIVSSEKIIGAAANMMRTGGAVPSYESYNALRQQDIGMDMILPQILKNVSSGGVTWNTTIVVQNTDTANSANVQLIFKPDPVTNPAIGGTLISPYTHNATIPAGGTLYMDQTTTPSDAQIGAKFFGSVEVISNRAVAPLAYSDGSGQILLAYPSYADGTTDYIMLPSIFKEIASLGENYSTAILIANFGSSSATVEIEYMPASGSYTVSGKDTVTVNPKAAKNVDQRYDAASITSATFMGGARIKCTNGQKIAAMVNLRSARYGTTYGGIMGGGTVAYVPIAYKDISSSGYGWSSTVIVQNADPAGGAANCNGVFYPGAGGTIGDPTSYPVASVSQFDLRYTTRIASEATFIGALKVTGSRNIGVMVQTRGAGGSGDALMAFLGLRP